MPTQFEEELQSRTIYYQDTGRQNGYRCVKSDCLYLNGARLRLQNDARRVCGLRLEPLSIG